MKDITKSPLMRGNLMGGALLMQFAFSYFIIFTLSLFSALFDRTGNTAALLSSSDIIASYSLNTFLTFISFFIFFCVVILLLRKNIAETCAFGLPDRKNLALPCVFLSLAMCILGSICTNIVYSFSQNLFHAVPYQAEYGNGTYTPFTFIFMIVNSALVPALIEEFAFRGAIIGIFKRYGDVSAIFISTIMFSLVHQNFVQIPYTFMFGLGLGLTRIVTNSIWPCILAHFINNAFVSVISLIPEGFGGLAVIIQLLYMLLLAILGIVSVISLSKRGVFKALSKPPFNKSSGSDFCKSLFAPLNVLAILIMLGFALSSFKAV